MNVLKTVAITAVATVAAVVILGAGLAVAQAASPWGMMRDGIMNGMRWQTQDGTPWPGHGPGMMGNDGHMASGGHMGQGMTGGDFGAMQAMHAWMTTTGGMHTVVWDSLAAVLNMTPDALQAALANGQTLAEVAEAQGVDQAQLAASLEAAMTVGLEQAVAQGVVTQDDAGEMLSHMAGRYAWMVEQMASGQMGAGMPHAHGARMGGDGTGGCPHDTLPATETGE